MSAKETQVGGNHYQKMAIQPIDYITKNELNWYQGNIVKYATRYPHKNQAVDDLRKVIHYAQLALEEELAGEPGDDYKPWADMLNTANNLDDRTLT